ncbi:hypothetical protein [Aeromicrobium sp. IC_218]|uniref:hypothetical protein n=1 Tax=Aeromicrobium sp. IC_218 TaxID=2545468 RepID=UPI00103FF23C|nr:hypothetical protein [Aeromicrobium sp. IC_218]TCI96300.1 hypothetical protein E0W78_15015 [Aeromicrobium sp. IC_218]
MTEHPETTSPRRAWLRRAFDDMGEADWTRGWVLYVLSTLLGAMLVGDRSISVSDAFWGILPAMLAAWLWRREHRVAALLVGALMLGLGFAAGASQGSW